MEMIWHLLVAYALYINNIHKQAVVETIKPVTIAKVNIKMLIKKGANDRR